MAIATGLMFYAALFQLTDAMQVIGLGCFCAGRGGHAVPMIIAAISYWLIGCRSPMGWPERRRDGAGRGCGWVWSRG